MRRPPKVKASTIDVRIRRARLGGCRPGRAGFIGHSGDSPFAQEFGPSAPQEGGAVPSKLLVMSLKETVDPRQGESVSVFRPVRFRPDIQGLRAVAVLLVVLYHAHLPGLTGGYIGVDVFFVISGFLITAHLLGSIAARGRVDFGDFYARRIRRILPASFAVLVLSTLAALVFIPPLILAPVLRDAIATALYVPNFQFANRSVDYLSDPNPSIFQHYWSLGVEEQFYLLWPAVLVVAFVLSRKSNRGILAALMATFVLSLVLCVWLTAHAQPWAFFMMPTRAWEFALGGLIAYAMTSSTLTMPRRLNAVLGWVGLAGIVACGVLYDEATVFPGTAVILPVVATGMVILAGSGTPRGWTASAALSVRPMVFIGALSYSMYLVHWPLLMIPQVALSDQDRLPLVWTLFLGVASLPLAWLLYRFVENPARTWKSLTSRPPRVTLLAALATTVVVVALLVAAARFVDTRPLESARIAPALDVTATLDATPFVPENLRPSLREASLDNPVIYTSGCHLSETETDVSGCTVGTRGPTTVSVALFGDSHAAQWYPALADLAERGDILLTSHTKSSCPSAITPEGARDQPYPECDQWRDGVIERLQTDPPDVVVLSNFAVSVSDPEAAPFPSMWNQSLQATISALSSRSRVIVIGDTPHFDIAPSTCLSAHIGDTLQCAGTPEASLWPEIIEAERNAARAGGGEYVDPIRYLCDESTCPVVLGDTLVYRDSHHLTATFSRSLGSELLPYLQRHGR